MDLGGCRPLIFRELTHSLLFYIAVLHEVTTCNPQVEYLFSVWTHWPVGLSEKLKLQDSTVDHVLSSLNSFSILILTILEYPAVWEQPEMCPSTGQSDPAVAAPAPWPPGDIRTSTPRRHWDPKKWSDANLLRLRSSWSLQILVKIQLLQSIT